MFASVLAAALGALPFFAQGTLTAHNISPDDANGASVSPAITPYIPASQPWPSLVLVPR